MRPADSVPRYVHRLPLRPGLALDCTTTSLAIVYRMARTPLCAERWGYELARPSFLGSHEPGTRLASPSGSASSRTLWSCDQFASSVSCRPPTWGVCDFDYPRPPRRNGALSAPRGDRTPAPGTARSHADAHHKPLPAHSPQCQRDTMFESPCAKRCGESLSDSTSLLAALRNLDCC